MIHNSSVIHLVRTISSSVYRKADGIMLVFDWTDPDSLINIHQWMGEIDHYVPPEIPKILVGNKCDEADKLKEQELKAKVSLLPDLYNITRKLQTIITVNFLLHPLKLGRTWMLVFLNLLLKSKKCTRTVDFDSCRVVKKQPTQTVDLSAKGEGKRECAC